MHIFTSDAAVRERQRAAQRKAGLTPDELKRLEVENERELRNHARWRTLCWGLFVAPAAAVLLYLLLAWLTAWAITPTPPASEGFRP